MRLSKKLKIKKMNKKEPMDVDITSLLDILVILLVFLLQSYSASDLRVDLVDNLSLPSSKSQDLGEMAVIVQINREQKIWVNDKLVGKLSSAGEVIPDLSRALEIAKKAQEEEFEKYKARNPSSEMETEALAKKENALKRLNLILDEELPYTVMRRVMHTAATAGFPEFKFIVRVGGTR